MRINRLTIAGFGPYKTAQTIDFDAFDDDGIFLITGNTGAGKSSILDAICFALYAGVPRYDGTQQQLRSDYCDPAGPTYVELWFGAGGKSYRVRRSPDYERPKTRGEGTTKKPTSAELFVRVGAGAGDSDDDWQGLAAIPRDVATELDAILGLTKDQFLQVILLAQNRFQKFLHAKNDERQAVLQSLFGTRRFADIEKALVERRKTLEARQAGSQDAIDQVARQVAAIVEAHLAAAVAEHAVDPSTEPGGDLRAGDDAEPRACAVPEAPDASWFAAALEVVASGVDAATRRVRDADEALESAEATLREQENTRRLQSRRDEASARLVELERNDEAIDEQRLRLEAAGRAELVWAHVTARSAARGHLERAVDAEADAASDYDTLRGAKADSGEGTNDISSTRLAAEADDATRMLGALDAALADETRLPRVEKEITAHEKSLSQHEKDLAAALSRAQELPAQLDEVVELRSVALVAAAARPAAAERVGRVRQQRTAALLVDTLGAQLDAAHAAEKTCVEASLEALASYDAILTRRLDGHAAELASTLVDGTPCMVCGSPTHPAPTSWSPDLGEPVTDADLERARERQARAADALAEAGLAVQRASAEHAAAEASAGGLSVGEADGELVAARAAEKVAAQAESEAGRLEADAARLRGRLEATTTELSALRTEGETIRTVLAAARTERAAVTERLAGHRGGFETVAQRVEHLQLVLETTRAYADALLVLAEKNRALADAEAALREHLAEQSFSSADKATQARLTPAERAAVAAKISAHDLAAATARATLAEAELQSLPAALVELHEATAARAGASAERDEARVAASSLDERVARVRALVTDALDRLDASEALRLEFETLRSLANSVEGHEPNTMRMRLESYVLAAQLEQIIRAANARLATMTSGRYALEHDDSIQYRKAQSGLGIAILDEHTGRARATHSLSGGETFLASLALALGLAEVVSNQAGGITLDTLFIDEGFGSLDSDTLAIAMSTLDSLRAGGRTIGLISHVEAMKEQIPSRLHIDVTPQGWSEIDQRS